MISLPYDKSVSNGVIFLRVAHVKIDPRTVIVHVKHIFLSPEVTILQRKVTPGLFFDRSHYSSLDRLKGGFKIA